MATKLILLDDGLIKQAGILGEHLAQRQLMLVVSESCTEDKYKLLYGIMTFSFSL